MQKDFIDLLIDALVERRLQEGKTSDANLSINEKIIMRLVEMKIDELSAETMASAREKASQRSAQAAEIGKGSYGKRPGKEKKLKSGERASAVAQTRFGKLKDRIDRRLSGHRGQDVKDAKQRARQGKGALAHASGIKKKERRAVKVLGLRGKKPKQNKKGNKWWDK